MLYYEVVYRKYEEIVDNTSAFEKSFRKKISRATDLYTKDNKGVGIFYIRSNADSFENFVEHEFVLGIPEDDDPNKYAKEFLNKLDNCDEEYRIEEITLRDLFNAVRHCEDLRHNKVLDVFGLRPLYDRCRGHMEMGFSEELLFSNDKKTNIKNAKQIEVSTNLREELKRIYEGSRINNVFGVPVHYILETNAPILREKIVECLLSSLYDAGRLKSKRFYCFGKHDILQSDPLEINTLFECSIGTAVVFYFDNETEERSIFSNGVDHYVEVVSSLINKFGNKVQFILSFPREHEELKEAISEKTQSEVFVDIAEDYLDYKRACSYLKKHARELGVNWDEQLIAYLSEGENYYATELNKNLEMWYSNKLRTDVYPQYKELVVSKKVIEEKTPDGNAYDELQNMIGLTEVKRIVDEMLDLNKAWKIFADKGIKQTSMSRHMIFTGNPGTAKTTVARLLARILKDNHVLSKGHIVEVGRGDLVGKYVGWTAQIVQRRFREAKGGILFIDEAYSLVDDKDGLYGDEAINTIVQEMENHRDDVVVIFAGYPDKMEGFLSKNPGLRSRIAFHIPFENYTVDELCQIADLLANKEDVSFTSEARAKLHDILAEAARQEDFGNGRYVRNVIEKAKMTQASRLVKLGSENVTRDDIKTLTADDIIVQPIIRKEKRAIGF